MKGWIKLKSKKLLGLLLVITLLSASVFGSINVFAANVTTNVALESYMPPVKTLFVDENFEDRTVDSAVTTSGTNEYSIKGIDSTGEKAQIAEAENNKYVKVNKQYVGFYPTDDKVDSIKNAKKLVISFDNSGSGVKNKFSITLGDSGVTVVIFESSNTNNQQYNIKIGSKTYTNIGEKAANKTTSWNKIFVVLTKEYDEETSAYYAYLDKILVDGKDLSIWDKGNNATQIVIPEKIPANALGANWWDCTKTVRFAANTEESTSLQSYFDNILIYEPQTVYFKDVTQTGLTIVNDSSEPVTGNLFLALYDTDGNLLAASPYDSGVTVAAGSSQTITAPTGITYPEGIAKAKIFYWNGTNLAPLCYSADVPLS